MQYLSSSASARTRFGAETVWSPVKELQLNAAWRMENASPGIEQLSAPIVVTPGARYNDAGSRPVGPLS